jgi:DNA-damage-inducible protein J
MATATTTINVRIDRVTKDKAQKIIEDMGLDISTAIKTYFKKIIQTGSIPFTFEQKGVMNNPRYLARLKKEVEWAKKYGKRFTSAKEMIDDILG